MLIIKFLAVFMAFLAKYRGANHSGLPMIEGFPF